MHNAFKAGFSSDRGCDWGVGKCLKALFHLFDEAPARRADYEKEVSTGDVLFPLPFCHHRWLENRQPAARAIDILPQLNKYIKAVSSKKVTKPQYDTVTAFVADPLAAAKLCFYIYVSRPVEEFLTKFQSDAPLAPFLYDELGKLIVGLLKKILKRNIFEGFGGRYKTALETIAKLSPTSPNTFRREVDVVVSTAEALKNSKVSEGAKLQFYM